jgi:hypothetical protein
MKLDGTVDAQQSGSTLFGLFPLEVRAALDLRPSLRLVSVESSGRLRTLQQRSISFEYLYALQRL